MEGMQQAVKNAIEEEHDEGDFSADVTSLSATSSTSWDDCTSVVLPTTAYKASILCSTQEHHRSRHLTEQKFKEAVPSEFKQDSSLDDWDDFDITGDTDELEDELTIVDAKHLQSLYIR